MGVTCHHPLDISQQPSQLPNLHSTWSARGRVSLDTSACHSTSMCSSLFSSSGRAGENERLHSAGQDKRCTRPGTGDDLPLKQLVAQTRDLRTVPSQVRRAPTGHEK
jgi:hypothetical protein